MKNQSVGTFYSYKFLGLSPVDGGPMFDDWSDHTEDLKGLSKYDTFTSVLTASGSREPIASGNLSTMVRWKNLRLNANFVYSLGAKTRLFGMYGSGTESNGVYAQQGLIKSENNLSRDYLERWIKPGDELHTNIPAIISRLIRIISNIRIIGHQIQMVSTDLLTMRGTCMIILISGW